jgi:alpha-galactosidase
VVVLGAGSLFFGREAIWQMVHSPQLNTGTLALVDTDAGRAAKMESLARKVVAHEGVRLAIEASTDRRDVLEGADFVVISFAGDTVKYRDIDCKLSAKYGIRMCSGDTIGPGGIFRALRELPEVMATAADVAELCGDAWLINYANPTAVMGAALKRYAPKLKTFALCDGHRMPGVRKRYAVRAGIVESEDRYSDEIDAKFDLRIAGPNHFTWMFKAAYDGKDVLGRIAESIARDADEEESSADSKRKFNNTMTVKLHEIFGAVPTTPAHTKEYVRFWQGLGKTPEDLPPLSLWDADARYKRHADMWRQVDDFLSGRLPIDTYMGTFSSDHATDIIETIASGRKRRFYVNTRNDGAVNNMPDYRVMELLCDVDGDGPRPVPVGDVPAGVMGLMSQVLDTHELTAAAGVGFDRALVRRAMLTDPLVSSIADADALIDELMAAERDALDPRWFY